jgi:hypothetical protein
MDILIKLIAVALARPIQTGSRRGAFAGASIGFVLAVAAAALISILEELGTVKYAVFIVLSVPAIIAGAMIGARFGPPNRPPDIRGGLRITNYNHAGAKLLIAMIFSGLVIAFASQIGRTKPGAESTEIWLWTGAVGFIALICLYVAARDVWYIEIGPWLKIRSLFQSRHYSRSDLQKWGFERHRGKFLQQTFTGMTELHLRFQDGYSVRIPVSGEISEAILQGLRGSPLELPTPIEPLRPVTASEIAAGIREARE